MRNTRGGNLGGKKWQGASKILGGFPGQVLGETDASTLFLDSTWYTTDLVGSP